MHHDPETNGPAGQGRGAQEECSAFGAAEHIAGIAGGQLPHAEEPARNPATPFGASGRATRQGRGGVSTDDARAAPAAGPRLKRCSRRSSRPSHDELLTVADAIRRLLAARGLNFTDLAGTLARPEREPETWGELARWLLENDNGRLRPHEREFAMTMARRFELGGEPSPKQGDWLRGLYARLGARNERQNAEQNSGGSGRIPGCRGPVNPVAETAMKGTHKWQTRDLFPSKYLRAADLKGKEVRAVHRARRDRGIRERRRACSESPWSSASRAAASPWF